MLSRPFLHFVCRNAVELRLIVTALQGCRNQLHPVVLQCPQMLTLNVILKIAGISVSHSSIAAHPERKQGREKVKAARQIFQT